MRIQNFRSQSDCRCFFISWCNSIFCIEFQIEASGRSCRNGNVQISFCFVVRHIQNQIFIIIVNMNLGLCTILKSGQHRHIRFQITDLQSCSPMVFIRFLCIIIIGTGVGEADYCFNCFTALCLCSRLQISIAIHKTYIQNQPLIYHSIGCRISCCHSRNGEAILGKTHGCYCSIFCSIHIVGNNLCFAVIFYMDNFAADHFTLYVSCIGRSHKAHFYFYIAVFRLDSSFRRFKINIIENVTHGHIFFVGTDLTAKLCFDCLNSFLISCTARLQIVCFQLCILRKLGSLFCCCSNAHTTVFIRKLCLGSFGFSCRLGLCFRFCLNSSFGFRLCFRNSLSFSLCCGFGLHRSFGLFCPYGIGDSCCRSLYAAVYRNRSSGSDGHFKGILAASCYAWIYKLEFFFEGLASVKCVLNIKVPVFISLQVKHTSGYRIYKACFSICSKLRVGNGLTRHIQSGFYRFHAAVCT